MEFVDVTQLESVVVKMEPLDEDWAETLINIGGETAGDPNDEMNQASSSEDIPLSQRLRPRKNVKLNDDSKRRPIIKRRTQMTSEHLSEITDLAADYRTTSKGKHSTKKPFSCNKCVYKCKQRGDLNKHLLTHTGEKPFSCDRCVYKCKQKSDLNKHLLTHTGEKPFSCDKCAYKCKQKGDLNKHLLIHTGEKPFACDKCNYKCKQKSDLNKHLLTHTGEKPFSCDKCVYKCKQKSDLNKHLWTHTGVKPFSCDKCVYKCKQKSDLNKHLLTHTADLELPSGMQSGPSLC